MANWRRRALGASGKRAFLGGSRNALAQRKPRAERSLRIEPFEERKLLAIDLVAVIPNEGAVIPIGVSPQPTITVAPRELTIRFNDGTVIDPSTLDAITVERAGFDGFPNGSIQVGIGYRGVGDTQHDVIVRFSENLPDDEYRLRIGGGLQNMAGEAFNQGAARIVPFDLNLGPQVVAVVPQPVTRVGSALSQATDTIVVYFNNDDLNPTAATDVNSYQLIRTNDTATPLDDTRFNPISAAYDNLKDKVTLKFAPGVLETAGTYRLRIGNDDPLAGVPLQINVGSDPGSTFGSARDLGTLFGGAGFESARLHSSIDPQDDVDLTTGTVPLPVFPGGLDEPGHRQIPAEAHTSQEGDESGEIPTRFYNFQDIYGATSSGYLHNLITETQKQRVREVFSIYSNYTGIQFVETADQGMTIVTGDLRALEPSIPTGPGGVAGLAGFSLVTGGPAAVMDLAENWGQSEFGGAYFTTAMHEIGHLLGLGHTYDLPSLTIMGSSEDSGNPPANPAETVVPGDADIIHMRYLYRPDSKDIDTYRFTLAQKGTVNFETVAQRLATNTDGWLDSVISIYDGNHNLIGRNDDYFGRDAYLKLDLAAGDYYVIVTASGNTEFDPNVLDSGIGGRSQGDYELRIGFEPAPSDGLTDATGVLLDGDHDGAAGGEYNFWFKTQTSTSSAATNRVIWVDKVSAASTEDGTLAKPFKTISRALGNAEPGDIVRIVGNNLNADGTINYSTVQSYNIGRDILGNDLSDGAKLEVPQGVTLMIDAGAVFKLREANIDAGTSAVGIDRSAGAIQVLGTPATNAVFTSYYDNLAGGTADVRLRRGDWGGIVFREDSDLESQGVFLNYVNHADIRYGGGQVSVNSIRNVYNPIHLVESRPTLTYNRISKSADAAVSADPNSFEETVIANYGTDPLIYAADYGRVGPDVYGNTLTDNSLNALFVRITTLANESLQPLTKSARFDDTDIVHVLAENLIIQGDAGGALFDDVTGTLTPRLNARLAVDPGIITKLSGARIETQVGGQFLAEATVENPAIFTSVLDDRYGRGGTFDTTNDADGSAPAPGDWAGLYFGVASSASIDHALIAHAGGSAAIEGSYARFNAVEIQQARVRIANSTFQSNDDGLDASNRNGRLSNDDATIFVRGAQPALINNVIRDGVGAAISINANALNAEFNNDPGRSTGRIDLQGDFLQNQGPLVVGNRLGGNEINGMVVRGATLTTESVWDDTDIAHVLFDEIIVPNFHTYGGLRLKSTPGHSLVVKLSGDSAGFTASGRPLDIDDRIGGTVQVVGLPGAPVVLTSLSDSTVGAGLKPDGTPQLVTGNPGVAPAAGDWRSIKLDRYSNDRNVAVVNEAEANVLAMGDTNNTTDTAQVLGGLAPDEKSADDTLRLGYEVHGSIAWTYDDRKTPDTNDDRRADVDVYSFRAKTGTEIWIDIDRSTQAFDSIVELIDANGSVVARSNDSEWEQINGNPVTFNTGATSLNGQFQNVHVMQGSEFGGKDYYTTNPRDAGMRVVLPGAAGVTSTYYVRVRANSSNLASTTLGTSYGNYQLQVRLRETNENPGSTVQFADIRYATNGVEIIGKPENSPLLGESAEAGANESLGAAQDLGNLLASNRNTLATSGFISGAADVDWYKFAIDYQAIQSIPGVNDKGGFWPTVFDLDYADGMARVDASIAVFDAAGNLVYWNRAGSNDDDQPRPLAGSDTTDLTRGSFGIQDPFTGSADLREGNGQVYYVAVSSSQYQPLELSQFTDANATNKLFRLEPIAEYNRIFTNRVNSSQGPQNVGLTADAFHLGDVVLYVNTAGGLRTVDPFTGAAETTVTGALPGYAGVTYGDVIMRNDGRLYVLSSANRDATAGNYQQISTGDGSQLSTGDDGIETLIVDPANPPNLIQADIGLRFNAYGFLQNGTDRRLFAVGARPDGLGGDNILFELDPNTGAVLREWTDPTTPLNTMLTNAMAAQLNTAPTISIPNATDVLTPFNIPGDISDGQTITLTGSGGTLTLEFNTGPTFVLADADHDNQFDTPVVDGDTFTVNGVTFEFNQGAYLTTGAAALYTDGDTFSITDSNNNTVTFEFDLNATSTAGNKVIPYSAGDNATTLGGKIATAINTSGLTTTATAIGARIVLINDNNVVSGLAGLTVAGVGVTPGNQAVKYEETETVATVGNAMVAAINANVPGVTASFARDRITLRGATTATSGSMAVGLGGGAGGVTPGNTEIAVDAADNGATIADRIVTAINNAGLGFTAQDQGDSVQVLGATTITSTGPFTVKGEGRGGSITGLAEMNGRLYAVTDAGDLFRVDNIGDPTAIYNASLTLIANVDDGGAGIPFSGLATGPQNVEGGAYSNLFFASDNAGNLWAMDTVGAIQSVFLDGANHVSTGIAGLRGLAFSTLDYNLWHITDRRGGDAGHSGAKTASSYYFGFERDAGQGGATNYDTNNGVFGSYDMPGGAYGTLTTDAFDLSGYTASDAPALYFTYFYNAETNKNLDTARVFVSNDGVHWGQVNIDGVNETFRNTDSWRQARIDLSGYAGRSGVRVRFDFSTAGDMHVGENKLTGELMRALAGNQLRDGDTFEIDSTTFEFDLGVTAIARPGKLINDGDTLVVDGTTFEFNKSGGVTAGNVPVAVSDDDPAGLVALTLAQTINAQAIGVTAILDEGVTISIPSVEQINDGDTITIDGTTYEFDTEFDGAALGNTAVRVLATDTVEDVAAKLGQAINLPGIKTMVSGNRVLVAGASSASETGTSALVVATSPRINLAGATTVTRSGTSVLLDGAVGVNASNVPVVIDAGMTSEEVAQAAAAAMDTVFVPAAGNVDNPAVIESVKVIGDQLRLIGHHATNTTGLTVLPFTDELDGDINTGFTSAARGQNNAFEGLYLDDFIVGLTGRGEQALRANGQTGYTADPTADPYDIKTGNYDLEIRRGMQPKRYVASPYAESDPLGRDPIPFVKPPEFPIPIDLRSRLGASFTLFVGAATEIKEGDTFTISDGQTTVVFEFDSNNSVGADLQPDGSMVTRTPVDIASIFKDGKLVSLSAGGVAAAVSDAINNRFLVSTPSAFKVRALGTGTDGRVELFNAAAVTATGSTSVRKYEDVNGDTAIGDENHFRDQGYTIVANNRIQDSLNYNILVDAGTRDVATQPHPGAIRNLREINSQRLVPGISLYNNLLVAGGDGGIRFSGDSATGVLGAVPFGRITNNTIYGEGAGVGVRVDDGASPTITNNIIAATTVGVQVVNGPGTVLGTNLYQDNGTNRQGATETFNIDLASGQPLFVDASTRNFYLAQGSKAIDSSRDSLPDRPAMTTVTGPLGIPPSPVLAPNFDLLGQLRVDDTTVSSPPIPGQGLKVFKDRGAIDRADFIGSTVAIIGPLDNDPAGIDTNPALTQLRLYGQKIPSFSFQFSDDMGTGIADTTVTAAQITFLRDGQPVPANDYTFSYDTTNDIVRLQATAGIFADGVYTVQFNNTATGIRDIADNPLRQNQADGRTMFTLEVGASSLSPWQNPGDYQYATLDVNNSGYISAIDAGIVLDYLNRNGSGVLPLPASPPPFYDVNGDGACTPQDLALIIDHLNRRAAGLLASFESSDTITAAAPDADVAFGLSVSGQTDTAAANLPAASGTSSTPATHASAIDSAIDDYAPEADLDSLDLFVADASEDDVLDSLFDDVEALLI